MLDGSTSATRPGKTIRLRIVWIRPNKLRDATSGQMESLVNYARASHVGA